MGSLKRSLLQSNIPSEQENKYFSASEGSASFMSTNSSNKSQISDQSHHFHHQIPNYGVMNSSPSTLNHPSFNFMSKDDGGSYDLCGDFDQALFVYFDGQTPSASSLQEQKMNCGTRPPTLNIFPSKPMHVDPSPSNYKEINTMSLANSANVGGSKLAMEESSMDVSQTKTSVTVPPPSAGKPPLPKAVKREGNATWGGTSTGVDGAGPKDAKTLRRLAQNREAARKSRLRKKAYIQQLESSRMKLTQLEQFFQRSARTKGYAHAGGSSIAEEQGLPVNYVTSVVFDVEYARWLDEHHKLMCELRAALMQEHILENELRPFVDNFLSHFNEIMNLKTMTTKSDVFYLLSGTWKTPVERCFMWIGGFRPSHLIKMILNQIQGLAEHQVIAICSFQQSTMDAEESLSQGLDGLNQSISDVIVSESLTGPGQGNMTNYMSQMGVAIAKLSTLEGFVRQADTLRHQTVYRLMNQLLKTHQAAKAIIIVSEYFRRLRSLSSLWLGRPSQD